MGYLYRHQLVRMVRTEYEEIVSEIQSKSSFEALPFANEAVTWPSEVGLCYPVFRPQTGVTNERRHAGSVTTKLPSADFAEVEKKDTLVINLPSDKESLLELKGKLSMELVWLRQAIASRQKVKKCRVKHCSTVTHN